MGRKSDVFYAHPVFDGFLTRPLPNGFLVVSV